MSCHISHPKFFSDPNCDKELKLEKTFFTAAGSSLPKNHQIQVNWQKPLEAKEANQQKPNEAIYKVASQLELCQITTIFVPPFGDRKVESERQWLSSYS